MLASVRGLLGLVKTQPRFSHRRWLQAALPAPPAGTRLDDLCLRYRTRTVLTRAGYANDLGRLSRLTVQDALAIRGFGITTLRDYLTALDRYAREKSAPMAVKTPSAGDLLGMMESTPPPWHWQHSPLPAPPWHLAQLWS